MSSANSLKAYPVEFYKPVVDRSAWVNSDVAENTDWLNELTEEDLVELHQAIGRNCDMPIEAIDQASFSMPTLSAKLLRIAEEVDEGRGFALLRGFPVDQYSEKERTVALVGIGAHFGYLISQNKYGELVGNVRSTGRKLGEPGVRGYDTDSELRYHNDECDTIVLMCLQPAKTGGYSSVVSCASVFNRILRDHPEHLEQLFEGYIFSLMGEERPGVGPVSDHRIPIFSWYQGKLSCRYTLNTIYQASAVTGISLTDREQAALDVVLKTSSDPTLRLDFRLQKGDLQFANNLSLLHSRTAFEDFEDPDKRRHILRLWLASHNPRPLAPEFEERFNDGWSFRRGIPVAQPDQSSG